MYDCDLDGTGSSGTIYGLLWSAGAKIISSGNRRRGVITAYAGNLAAAGSRVDLVPAGTLNSGASTSIDLSSLVGHRSIMLQSSSPSNPTIAPPAILFIGQRFSLTIHNTGSTWTVVTVTGAVPSGYGGVAATGTKNLVFEAVDYALSGTPQWVCLSERG
jgi:hypothetical protein